MSLRTLCYGRGRSGRALGRGLLGGGAAIAVLLAVVLVAVLSHPKTRPAEVHAQLLSAPVGTCQGSTPLDVSYLVHAESGGVVVTGVTLSDVEASCNGTTFTVDLENESTAIVASGTTVATAASSLTATMSPEPLVRTVDRVSVTIGTSSATTPLSPQPGVAPPTSLPPPGLPGVTVVGGATPDTTAARELTRVFPYAKGDCPSSRTVVVATTKVFQDALSSQYLAEDLTTGTLLTPTLALSQVTARMLREEGVSTVYIVGGPLAVGTAVARQIADMTAYECGGATRTPTTGKIVVHRIWGKTRYGTSKAVAEFVGAGASLSFPAAYATTNATGGTGMFDTTGAKGTAAPTGAEPTAILANGTEFQDAQAASVVSYRTKVPMLLNAPTALVTTAVGAIRKLGIRQVVLMGGTMAVTNGVEASLVERTGVAVLRIAGRDFTDTARQLARFEAAAPPVGLGWTPGHRILLARGNGFTDGIAGGVLENAHDTATGTPGSGRPLLLTESPTAIGTYLTTFLKVTGHTGIDEIKTKTIAELTVLGGPLAVSTTEMAAMQTDLSH